MNATILKAVLLALSMIGSAPASDNPKVSTVAMQAGGGHSTSLSWSASSSASCLTAIPPTCTAFSYNVFRGTAAGAESATPLNSAPISGLTYSDPVTLTALPQQFFYVVQAVETAGGITATSANSNEVSVSFPGMPTPVVLQAPVAR